jgi:hypothetical protein
MGNGFAVISCRRKRRVLVNECDIFYYMVHKDQIIKGFCKDCFWFDNRPAFSFCFLEEKRVERNTLDYCSQFKPEKKEESKP